VHLVDTSVWIHALRPEGSARVRALLRPLIVAGETAITDWILLELMTGLRRNERADALRRTLEPVHRLEMSETTWSDAWANAAALRRKGLSPTAADCLIATVAIQRGATLVHCDSDFEAMTAVLPLRTVGWTDEVR
jgi:predicted nucleic acid-binding protein